MGKRRSKTKKCTVCGKRKSLEKSFYPNGKYYRSECKVCTQEARALYVQENLEEIVARKRRKRAEMRAWFQDLKAQYCCYECGEDDPRCLDFHHRDPEEKEFILADAVRRGWGKKKILAEIDKCDVLCSNCHRKHHAAD